MREPSRPAWLSSISDEKLKEATNDNPFADEMPVVKEDVELPKASEQTPEVPNVPSFDFMANETYDINKDN